MHYLIVLLGYLISGAFGQFYFVTVPNVLRYEYDEIVTVSVFGLNNANVEVWLQLGDKKISGKAVVVTNEVLPAKTTVRLTEHHLIDYLTEMEERPSLIKICSKYGSHSDCQDVLISYDTGYIIMQTDKPIYTPKQKVKIRALVFDEYLKAVKNQEVRMDLISPSNRTLGRKFITNSSSGFYMNEFELPPRPEIGLWTARAFLKGQYDTNARALFNVEEYVLPTYGVDIEVDLPYILEDTPVITITVKAKYVYGKPVNGNARLELKLRGDVGSDALMTTDRKMLIETPNQNSVVSFTIPVADIMNSNAIGNQFPNGKRLEVIATVYEAETGNEEDAIHASTIFTTNPYKFKFTQSKLNFRPGMEYFLKVEMLFANGAPAADKEIEVLMFQNKAPNPTKTKTRRTDSEGNILESFPTTHQSKEIKFRVRTKDGKWTSDDFIVTPYVGKNQIQVELVTVDGRKIMRAYTNAQQGSYTGMLFMVVSRGNVVYTKFQQNGNKVSDDMTDLLEKSISPSGRLIVFYVDKSNNEIVADSVKFNVRHMCRGKTLSMESDRMDIKPGDTTTLKINGDPFMHVGLNIMDKALLLLNKKNVLRRNTMFDTLESHDLGCGEGSGSDSAGIFKNTGLTVLTNAKITKAGLKRNSIECEARQRKKRQALEDVCKGADPFCCEKGYAFADEAIYLADNPKDLDPLTVCLGKAKQVVRQGSVTMLCVNGFYKSCLRIFADMHHPVLSARSLDFETEYISDLERVIEGGGKLRTRTDFRESWQFTVMDLDQKGEKNIRLGYPDSITDWMVQGIGISSEGVCIAEPVNVTAFKDFFIQLELPYKATRLEHLEAKATIFNYGLDEKTANVYLDGIDGLCFDRGTGKQSRRTQAILPPNTAQTIRFPMVPMKRGKLPVTVSAFIYEGGSPETDAIKKYLEVENEGIEVKIPIQVCLDPLEQADDCQPHQRATDTIQKNGADSTQVITVDLTLPKGSIPTTGFGTAYLQGNLMDNVVRTLLENGVESLFQKPAGCGEQTMLRLAPTVSAMKYLKQTKQVTAAIEETGNKYIRDGVNREIDNYRHPDGGYSAWQRRAASTWLTAFVSKIFCQAKTVVDDAVETHDIASSIIWLVDNVRADGSYEDKMPVIHREMIGQIKENRDPSLTAFVLVALQECGIQVRGRKQTIDTTIRYLERLDKNMLRSNPYILALSTYALAMTKSGKSHEFKRLLMDTKQGSKKDGSYWGNPGGFPASAHSVETTAYALLAMLQFNDIKTSGEIVRWLTSQRDARGAFRTTQDTVVGLQALSEYSMRTYSQDLDLKISLFADGWQGQQFAITNENSVYQKIIKRLPVERGDNKLKIEVSGTGTGRMMIDLRYNRLAKKNEQCGFNVSDILIDDVPELDRVIADLGKCDVCNKCAGKDEPPAYYDDIVLGDDHVDIIPRIGSNMGRIKRAPGGRGGRGKRATAMLKCVKFSVSAAYKETGMTLVRFGLETGVEVIEEDLEKLRDETENIDAYENDGKGFVVFYLNKGSFAKTDFIFRLKDTFDDLGGQRSRQPAAMEIYDYYNPDLACTKMYRTIGEAFSYKCDNSLNPQCQCLQNMCVKPSMGSNIANMKDKPALKLRVYTCSPEKADYAVKVQITGTTYDLITGQKKVTAVVLKSIHKGQQSLERDDEMLFFYPLSCNKPSLVEGEKVFIIGKDGSLFTDSKGNEEYQYPMMGTTLVLKSPKGRAGNRFGMIMRKYENIMSTRGCES